MLFCCWSHALREMRCVIALVAISPLHRVCYQHEVWQLRPQTYDLVGRVHLQKVRARLLGASACYKNQTSLPHALARKRHPTVHLIVL
jgi:hypothetical protein